MSNSKYILAFLVLTGIVPATLHNTIHANSSDAAMQTYNSKDSEAKPVAVASQDSWEVPIARSGKMIG